LKSSGEADVSSSTEGPCLERTIEDAAIQHAIEELKRSTSAIEKHSEVLKIQQDVVASLVANSTKQSDARVSANTLQYQLWATEHRQIGNEVSQNLKHCHTWSLTDLSRLKNSIELCLIKLPSLSYRLKMQIRR
jgi:hypothetical protein